MAAADAATLRKNIFKNELFIFEDVFAIEAYRDRHNLPPTATTNTALRRLVKESIVEKVDGTYMLTDPLLAYHLKSRDRSA